MSSATADIERRDEIYAHPRFTNATHITFARLVLEGELAISRLARNRAVSSYLSPAFTLAPERLSSVLGGRLRRMVGRFRQALAGGQAALRVGRLRW